MMPLFATKKEPPPACTGSAPVRGTAEGSTAACCGKAPEGICCVKVLGSGCKNCHALWESTKEAVRSLGLRVEVEYVTDMQQIMTYGVMSMPALVVNDQVVSMGKVLKAPDIARLLSARISRT